MTDTPQNQGFRRRRKKLVRPHLQWRLIGTFLGVSCLALIVQFTLFAFLALRFANGLAREGEYLINELPRMLGLSLAGSVLVLLPMTVVVGIGTTFRLLGPLYRFGVHFRQLAAGEDPGPCRLREGDELQDLCADLNAAIDAVRARAEGRALPEPGGAAPRPGDGPGDSGLKRAG